MGPRLSNTCPVADEQTLVTYTLADAPCHSRQLSGSFDSCRVLLSVASQRGKPISTCRHGHESKKHQGLHFTARDSELFSTPLPIVIFHVCQKCARTRTSALPSGSRQTSTSRPPRAFSASRTDLPHGVKGSNCCLKSYLYEVGYSRENGQCHCCNLCHLSDLEPQRDCARAPFEQSLESNRCARMLFSA